MKKSLYIISAEEVLDAEFVLIIINGKIVIKKNRNQITRMDLIKKLDELTN